MPTAHPTMTSLCLNLKALNLFNEGLDQIDKVTSLTNKDPYKLALTNPKAHLARPLVCSDLHWDGTKLRNPYATILAL